MELSASNESPVVNVCFVVKGWNTDNISVQLDGRVLDKKTDYRTGIIRNLEKNDLVLWITMKSMGATKILLTEEQ